MTGRRQRRPATAPISLLTLLLAAACGSGATADKPRPAADVPRPTAEVPRPADKVVAPITLAFAGDVHFEGVSKAALSGGLAAITPLLSAADLTVANLETAVTSRGSAAAKQFTFRAPASSFTVLKAAGIDVVTMANNHALDYGQVGLTDSLAASRDAGLPVIGAGPDADAAFAAHVVDVRGTRVALVGATQVLDDNLAAAWTAGPDKPGLASAKDETRLVQAVTDARGKADVVVVDLHWGTELESCATATQRTLASRLAAAGADVIVGSHAHVLLGGGWLGRTYVDYGLGNFVFYARTPETQASGVLTLTLQGRRTTAAQWAPARIAGGVPVPLTGAAAASGAAAKERLRGCTGLAAAPS